MKRTSLTLKWLAALACLILFATGARAQLARTYVAHNGADANPCTRSSPCRQIDRGIDAVQPGGEVVVMSTGNYHAFTVDKAVTVTAATGAAPGITVTAGVAATISAGPSEVVTLRGLTLNGLNPQNQSFGVASNSGAALHLYDCTFLNFGIGVGSGTGVPVFVKNSAFRGNTSGIQVASTTALIDHCKFENNSTGLFVGTAGKVTVRNCDAFGNGTGFYAGTARVVTEINIEDCVATNNGTAVYADPDVVIRVANSTITNNTVGLFAQAGGQILSRTPATNTVAGNGSGEVFTAFYIAK
jgi:nitrous oxidase accessory protein NosD